MISGETMHYQKVRRILQYHVANKLLATETFARHGQFLFYIFRDEKELLLGFKPLYQNNCIVLFFNLMRTPLTITTYIAKLKIMKQLGQNIPMKMIQKTYKLVKLLQFPTL